MNKRDEKNEVEVEVEVECNASLSLCRWSLVKAGA